METEMPKDLPFKLNVFCILRYESVRLPSMGAIVYVFYCFQLVYATS
jgi:hypothetical protein